MNCINVECSVNAILKSKAKNGGLSRCMKLYWASFLQTRFFLGVNTSVTVLDNKSRD